ncbi:MAG: periplasmic heavy metal sensor [Desulfobacterales bacterium]|nr:periplasmic heavy metal sensor [Desulfobacterales bacterium]
MRKLTLIFGILFVFIFVGINAFARMGDGTGPQGNTNCPYMKSGSLTEEQSKKLDEEKAAFYKATEDIRQAIYEKEIELKAVLAKKEPDVKKAEGIQKEISDLNAQLDLKRLDLIVKAKKITPEADRLLGNCGRGMMMGGRGMNCMGLNKGAGKMHGGGHYMHGSTGEPK